MDSQENNKEFAKYHPATTLTKDNFNHAKTSRFNRKYYVFTPFSCSNKVKRCTCRCNLGGVEV
jgi:hypothetical protein